ncbi:MAG TPA: zf-HC2 domain-containing protein [Bryobacteraceae bacterium]|jgi:anti-sigma factor RsiW|nr:zf-HC2 domain-containing protein [Bryobacteraceae bacterium]
MSCQTVLNSLSEFLDHRVSGDERTRVTAHLAECRECAAHLRDLSELRNGLKNMPQPAVPERLRTQLQVLASHERARWNATKTLPLALRTWAVDIKLAADNLMRPLAVPLAGGLVSALLLFALLVPTLGSRPSVLNDVPTGFYTAATLVEAAPPDISNDEAIVELHVDSKGQATDYSVQRGQVSPAMQADLTQMMFFARFTPATWFGQPTNGKVLVSFRRINYVVRG